MKILICGLSGSGKTTLADKLHEVLLKDYSCQRLNADEIRQETNNWNFSLRGRIEQAHNITARVDNSDFIICDFIAPLKELRSVYDADFIIWMDTVKESKFSDTDALFEPVPDANYIVTTHSEEHVTEIIRRLFE